MIYIKQIQDKSTHSEEKIKLKRNSLMKKELFSK